MLYRDFPESDKTYIVMHKTGFGVMESPYYDKEIVYETNDSGKAHTIAEYLTETNNTTEEIKSSWTPNTYWVYLNTATPCGKEIQKIEQNPIYYQLYQGGPKLKIIIDTGFITPETISPLKIDSEETKTWGEDDKQ